MRKAKIRLDIFVIMLIICIKLLNLTISEMRYCTPSSNSKCEIVLTEKGHLEIIFSGRNLEHDNLELMFNDKILNFSYLKNYMILNLFAAFMVFFDYRVKIKTFLRSKFNGSSYKDITQ